MECGWGPRRRGSADAPSRSRWGAPLPSQRDHRRQLCAAEVCGGGREEAGRNEVGSLTSDAAPAVVWRPPLGHHEKVGLAPTLLCNGSTLGGPPASLVRPSVRQMWQSTGRSSTGEGQSVITHTGGRHLSCTLMFPRAHGDGGSCGCL